MEFGLLGVVEARQLPTAPPLDLGSPLQRVLLGLLLTEPGRSVSLDRIVEELWGDAPPADPEGSVHTYVSRLRRVLEPGRLAGEPPRLLERTPAGYRLAVPPDDVDAGRFEGLAADARTRLTAGDGAGALAAAEAALALWRGPVALEDAGDREFAVRTRERLGEQRLGCREDRTAALLALGRATEAVAEAEALVADQPLRERPWVLLIDALAAAGRPADALARYTDVHRLFDDELGVVPGPALRAAQARALGDGGPSAPPPPAADEGRRGMVGRVRELALLRDLVERLPRSGPRFVLIDGEPGIGKSRLAAEVTATAEAGGARVAWGRCHEDDDSPALWPWHQVLAAVTGTAGELPADGAFAAFERVLTALVAASAGGRVVVVVDDLHWADPASLRLLSFLAVELQHGPIAVLCTCRSDVRDAALGQVRATLARTAGFAQLTLGPMGPAETARLVRDVAGEIGEEAAADLHDRSGGNPFFATELARVAAAAADGAVPPGVRDVVDRRLGRLPVVVRPVLHLAATAGQRFDVALLQRAAPDDVDTLLDALDAAEAAELVRPSGPGWMAFAHALVRDSLLAELSQLRRSRLHARLAAALPDTADVFERAHHLVSGRPFTDGRETVAACAAAARRAVADHAHDNAARWWERALAALDADAAGGLRQELLLQAGESMARAGSWAAGQQLLTAAIGTALDTGDLDSAATAAEQFSHIGGIWHPVAYGDYPAPLVDRLEALVRATGSGSGPAHVRALAALASVVQYGADRGRGVRESARAVSAARRVGHPGLLLEALAARVVATWLPGHEADMIEAADELLALRPPPEAEIVALARRAAARLTLGDVAGHALDLDRAEELAQEHELPLVQSQLLSMQAARANLHGDFEVALALIDRAEALAQRTQLYGQSMQHLAMRSFVWIDQGCLPERLAAAWPREPVPDPVGSQPLLRALALLQAGRTRAAADVVGRALEPFPEQWDWVSLTSWQAEVAADLAAAPDVHLDASVPAAIADRLLPYESQFAVQGGIGALGPVAISLARAEAAAGRVDDAERHLREGVDVAQAHELRPALARGHLALAELLAGRGRRAESAAEAVAARDVAETIGMRHAALRAARLAHE